MSADPTTAAVQRYLDALAGDQPAALIVRGAAARSIGRKLIARALLELTANTGRLTLPPR